MNQDTPESARKVEKWIKLTAVAMLALFAMAASAATIYLLNDRNAVRRDAELEKAKEEARAEGYTTALEQLVDASETNREMTVTVGEKTVKFIVVSPVETTPKPEAEPEDMP
jgi:hypothetical protein